MDEHAGMSRRSIVRAAAGAFALAASGLYLPQDAEAREGTRNGELGGRRGKDHRGRNRRRDAGDQRHKHKNDKQQPPGRGLLKNIAVRALNLSGNPFPLVFINDVVRISNTVRAHDSLAETDLQDDEGWIWMQTCDCQVTGIPLGLAIHINNSAWFTVWYQVWADMGLMSDGLHKLEATWPLTNPITIGERQEVVIPSSPGQQAWDLRLRRFDDSALKRFELEYRGIK